MSIVRVLTWIVLATLMLAIATQLSEQKAGARLPPDGFALPDSDEGFKSGGPMDALGDYLGWETAKEEHPETEGPMKGREVPDLLLETAPAERQDNVLRYKTSQRCFESDFQEQSNKVGSYVQRTNNYKRAGPDSCSAPNHEFVGSFYEPVTLPTA